MMHSIFKPLTKHASFTGELKTDIQLFLISNECPITAKHCLEVGSESRRIAMLFNANVLAAETAGWLHDISAVIPNNERIEVARELQIEVLPEEERFPMIIHQKISKVMAQEIFNINDQEILNAKCYWLPHYIKIELNVT